jgi:hypothetical protein
LNSLAHSVVLLPLLMVMESEGLGPTSSCGSHRGWPNLVRYTCQPVGVPPSFCYSFTIAQNRQAVKLLRVDVVGRVGRAAVRILAKPGCAQ